MPSEPLALPVHLMFFTRVIIEEQKYETEEISVNMTSLTQDYPQFTFGIRISQAGREDLNLFAKVTELNNDWSKKKIKPFEKERWFYSTVLKTYRQLEDKHGVPEEHRLKVPLCYGTEALYKREILVIEDLTSKDFGLSNRLESVDWPYAAAAITELAKFHALSLAYQNENPTEFAKLSKYLTPGLIEKTKESSSLFASFKSMALKVVRDENKENLKEFLDNQDLRSLNDMLKPLNRKVIVHGHFWPKNMMHKVLDDDTVEVIPLDYGHIQVGSPVTDLLHFIYTATDAPFRVQHQQELVQLYLAELIKAAARFGLDIAQEYSIDALEPEMTEKLPYGLLSAVTYLPVLALDNRSDETLGPQEERAHAKASAEMYSQRLNQIVDEYASKPILADPQFSKDKPCGMCFLC